MRAVGLDLGRRRIGVAVSDSAGRLATPYTVIHAGDGDYRVTVASLVQEVGAETVVVGLPLSLDGSVGPAARWATDEAAELARVLDVPVRLHDERLTSVAATRAGGGGGSRRRADGRIDASAAAIMLQSWLDGPRSAGQEEDVRREEVM